MILCDSRTGSKELAPYIRKLGVPVDVMLLEFADVAFEGNGPKGAMPIAIERKTIGDMLQCIDSARYASHQRPGMAEMYKGGVLFLILEGEWIHNSTNGMLMEAHNGTWHYCRPSGRQVMYSKLYRYLLSVELTGTHVVYSYNLQHTAYNIVEMFHYFQKKWGDHTAMKEMHRPPVIDVMRGDPPLVRKWAASIKDIGVKTSELVARRFKTPIALAQADEAAWLSIPGIGVKTAQRIVREIRGWK